MKFFSKVSVFSIAMTLVIGVNVFAQTSCQPYIKIDGNLVTANSSIANGLELPLWLKAGQTLAAGSMVNSISVVEFSIVNGNTLQFVQVLSVTSSATVPANTVWKVESIVKQPPFALSTNGTFTSSGTFTFAVPYCASNICVEVWGGGGGGGGNNAGTASTSGGGGGGGYAQQCFTVTPGTVCTVVVGGGGGGGASGSGGNPGGTSSVTGTGVSINATGGAGGGCCAGGTGGAGGTGIASASVKISGGNGVTGNSGSFGGGTGGFGANGGNGGTGALANSTGGNGSAVGGGGGGGGYVQPGGAGAVGKVIISW